ncbi:MULTISPECIES: hypothetical protein [unclassified Roseburia]|uniref:hypothetical protein n=1 Tax=unclassified Roseburia TaxID=2637578 RepID=UPI001FA8F3F8|nr:MULTISPECIES: hypothetical protein [unclassified Roseburia]
METDSLYYIMDYSGHYYRTNKADQLVAVAGEQDATVFTFAQANSRICVGKKAAFYCMVPIEENVEDMSREVSGSDEISDNFSALPVEEQEENNDEYVSPVKELTYDEVMEPIEKNVASYDLSEMDWAEYLTHFTYLVEGLKDYRDELSKKHSDIEQKICDILHYIELCETDDNEATDLIELLRVCRENRRDIKDELQRIEYFQNSFGTNTNVTKAKQALKSIKGLEKRKYKPRKYEELFENCILKDRRLQKDDIHGTVHISSDTKQRYSIEPTFDEKDGEVTMVEERSYTPLDEKENDWVSFARQQAEFYRNAGQYIINLQIDIKELDTEIENILLEIEDANCNVTQGYKVFKRLKELRLEKKAKIKELNCLYALTDYIDCESLADTCEDNLAEIEDIMEVPEHSEVTKMQLVDEGQEENMHIVEDMVG